MSHKHEVKITLWYWCHNPTIYRSWQRNKMSKKETDKTTTRNKPTKKANCKTKQNKRTLTKTGWYFRLFATLLVYRSDLPSICLCVSISAWQSICATVYSCLPSQSSSGPPVKTSLISTGKSSRLEARPKLLTLRFSGRERDPIIRHCAISSVPWRADHMFPRLTRILWFRWKWSVNPEDRLNRSLTIGSRVWILVCVDVCAACLSVCVVIEHEWIFCTVDGAN